MNVEQAIGEESTESSGLSPKEKVSEQLSSETKPLRIWPVLVVIVAIWGLRVSGVFVEEPDLIHLMLQWFAPGLIAGLVFVWWIALSRAPWRERLAGAIGIILIGASAVVLEDKTVQGMGTIIFAIPVGMTMFGLGAVVVRAMKPARLIVALLAGLVGFGYWNLIRIDEIHGDFSTVRSWRWEPSPEQRFLAELDSRETVSDEERQSLQTASENSVVWPGFRGPERTGEMPGVSLPRDWAQDALKEVWRNRVGPGWSSFSVAGDLIFTQEQRGDYEAVVCLLAEDGREVWAREDESRFWESIAGAGPRATPTIAGDFVYALGANGYLNCLTIGAGELVWQRKLIDDAGRQPPTWGFSSSPLVTQGVVVVHAGGAEDKGVLAYDKATGELIWSCPAGDHSYSSPQLSTIDGKECIVMLCNKGLSLIEPTDGTVLGNYDWPYNGYRVIQPLVFDDSKILLGTPFKSGTRCVSASWDGERFQTEEVWHSRRISPYFNDFVEHEGYLYGFDNSIFTCINLNDGSQKWRGGRYGNGQVLLLPEQNQLLVISDEGELVLLDASPDGHREIAKKMVFDARTWNHPVVIGNRLFVRNAEEAACLKFE